MLLYIYNDLRKDYFSIFFREHVLLTQMQMQMHTSIENYSGAGTNR